MCRNISKDFFFAFRLINRQSEMLLDAANFLYNCAPLIQYLEQSHIQLVNPLATLLQVFADISAHGA
jgi:hypothetical protein